MLMAGTQDSSVEQVAETRLADEFCGWVTLPCGPRRLPVVRLDLSGAPKVGILLSRLFGLLSFAISAPTQKLSNHYALHRAFLLLQFPARSHQLLIRRCGCGRSVCLPRSMTAPPPFWPPPPCVPPRPSKFSAIWLPRSGIYARALYLSSHTHTHTYI